MEAVKSDQQGAPQHSPKLKMAAMEIKATLEKYDIAGIAHLHEPGFNEYVIHISPTFSVVELNAANHLKVNPPVEMPDDPTWSKKKVATTVNMLANLKMHTMKLSMVLQQAEATVRKYFGIELKPGGPHIQLPKNGLS